MNQLTPSKVDRGYFDQLTGSSVLAVSIPAVALGSSRPDLRDACTSFVIPSSLPHPISLPPSARREQAEESGWKGGSENANYVTGSTLRFCLTEPYISFNLGSTHTPFSFFNSCYTSIYLLSTLLKYIYINMPVSCTSNPISEWATANM